MKKERQYTVITEKGEDGNFIGTALELKGCHSQGKTVDELINNMREAITLCLEVQKESGTCIKEIVGIKKVTV